jgi:hypothetical protein
MMAALLGKEHFASRPFFLHTSLGKLGLKSSFVALGKTVTLIGSV